MNSMTPVKEDYKMSELSLKLWEMGVIPVESPKRAMERVQQWIKSSKRLRLRKVGHNFVANEDEIYQIACEFSEGGEGWWEPGKARFLPGGILNPDYIPEEKFELVIRDNPIEMPKYGSTNSEPTG